ALQPAGPEIPKDRGGSRPVVLLEGGAHAAFEGILPEQVRGEGVDGPDLDPVELGERADSAAAGRRRVAEELETAVELVDRPPCPSATWMKNQPSRMKVAKAATACSTSSRQPSDSSAVKARTRRSSRISSTSGSPRR